MVEALSLEWAVFINQRVNKGDFDAIVLGWAMGLDPDIYQIFHSSQTGDFQLNFVGYRNARADELMVRVRREYDAPRQVEMARELHRLVAAEQPYTFLYVRRALSLIDGKVVRMRRGADGAPAYLPFAPDKLGRLGHYFREWVKTPAPVLPPYRPELTQG
jgi:ABC-type transport system substrate-binding protein